MKKTAAHLYIEILSCTKALLYIDTLGSNSMLFLLLCILFVCVYAYIKRRYFTLRPGIPGLSPQIFLGNLFQSGVLYGGKPLTEVLSTFKKRYGDIFQFWLGPGHFIMVNEATDVQHIFTNRHIYDQGDIFIQQCSVLFPDSLICTKGKVVFLSVQVAKTCKEFSFLIIRS